MATHKVIPGKETEFEANEIKTMDLLKETNGMVASLIMTHKLFNIVKLIPRQPV